MAITPTLDPNDPTKPKLPVPNLNTGSFTAANAANPFLSTFASNVQSTQPKTAFGTQDIAGLVATATNQTQQKLAQPAGTAGQAARDIFQRTEAEPARQMMTDTLGRTGDIGTARGNLQQGALNTKIAQAGADLARVAEKEDREGALDTALKLGNLGVSREQLGSQEAIAGLQSGTQIQTTGMQAGSAEKLLGMTQAFTGSQNDLDRALQREVEAGRISQQDKDRAMQEWQAKLQASTQTNIAGMQVGSAEKIAMAQLGLDERRLAESARQFGITTEQAAQQFGETMKLNYDQLSEQQKQFLATLGLDQAKFEESKNQFAQSMGLEQQRIASQEKIAGLNISSAEKIAFAQIGMDAQRLEETARQFNISTDQAAQQFTQTMQYNYDQLSQNDKQFLANLGLDQQKFEEAKRQFESSNVLAYAQLDQQHKEAFGYTDPQTGQYVPGRFNLEQQGIDVQKAQTYGYTDPATGERVMGQLELAAREIESREGIAADQIEQAQREAFGYTDENGVYQPGRFNLEQQGIDLQTAQIYGYTDEATGEHVKGELEIAGARLGLEGETLDLQRAELLGVDAEGDPIMGSDGQPIMGKMQILAEELKISQQNADTNAMATQWQTAFQYASILDPEQGAALINGIADDLGMEAPAMVTTEEADAYKQAANGDPEKAAELAWDGDLDGDGQPDRKVFIGLDGVTSPPTGSTKSNPLQVPASDTPMNKDGNNLGRSYPSYWEGASSTWRRIAEGQYITFGTTMYDSQLGTVPAGSYKLEGGYYVSASDPTVKYKAQINPPPASKSSWYTPIVNMFG